MKIQKIKNENGNSFDFEFIQDDKCLSIFFAGNLDLYFSLRSDQFLPIHKNITLSFDITKENYEVFMLFDDLYKEIINGKIFTEDSEGDFDEEYNKKHFLNSYEYRSLVDEDKNINWISDDGAAEEEDILKISLVDEDTYRLSFIRNDKPLTFGFKSNRSITARIRTSGSRYNYFYVVFMRFFQKLQDISTDEHQIHFEEVVYTKKYKKDYE